MVLEMLKNHSEEPLLDVATLMWEETPVTTEDEQDSLSREIDAPMENEDLEDEDTQCSSRKESTTAEQDILPKVAEQVAAPLGAAQPGGAQPGQSPQCSERSTAVAKKSCAVASQQKRPSADTQEQPEYKKRRTFCGASVTYLDRSPICFVCGRRFVQEYGRRLNPSLDCPHICCGTLTCWNKMHSQWLDIRQELTGMDNELLAKS